MNGEEVNRKEGISGIFLNYNLTFFSLERHYKKRKKNQEKNRVLSQVIQAIYWELNIGESLNLRWALRIIYPIFIE